MELIDILIIISLIIASVLGLYLIKLIRRLFVTIEIVETEIKELDSKISPLLLELQDVVDTGKTVVSFAKEQTDSVSEMVDKIKNMFGGFKTKKEEKSSTQSNAHNLITNLRALVKGATSFISEFK